MKSAYIMKELPEDERPREKLVLNGAGSLSNPELLAILLRTGMKGMSAIELSKKILYKNKDGLAYLGRCRVDELVKINGIGKAKACQLLAALELGKRMDKLTATKRFDVHAPKDVANRYMSELRFLDREVFKVLYLNTKNEILKDENISVGSLNASIVHPREVFKPAIVYSSNAIILMHNHPSGNPSPSQEDIQITKRLSEAGELIGIKVLDHIVIGDGNYYSLKENGLF
ncbi:MAG: DNA repair protein RadC [Peptostreptococcaceae bacterium]|nr:DNA repair protein RadC [Peptostreptococcaceae bacterium]